ncbi:FusB/FusC family EF-G-binding protein [Halobacillus rhizosphaerae]|uniref:FusB/FusC family EF-G-binding protein n=1 Tax=Halobacillus rhizosphaerae TaxID=3064889 RepID=UPI00398B808F
MDAFIRSDQYNFIKEKTSDLLHAHSSVNDTGVMNALKSMTQEKSVGLFKNLDQVQSGLVNQIQQVEDQADAVLFLSRLKQYVIPFPELSEDELKQLFPKVKKLHVPDLSKVNHLELSYLGWNDLNSNRKYIVFQKAGNIAGLSGAFTPSRQPGICSICNGLEKVGMFTATTHRSSQGTVKRGNYICKDSSVCNQNLIELDSFAAFVNRMKG